MTQNISLGLDIGVSSVGFSILDYKAGEIIELGADLFKASDAEKNQTRRVQRGGRRLGRRKQNRRIDAVKLFKDYGLINDSIFGGFEITKENYYLPFNHNQNPYELRVKGQKSKLTKEELSFALYNLVKRRGISYTLDDEAEQEQDSSYSKSLEINKNSLEKKSVAEIQLARLNENHKVRGQVNSNDDTLLNVFPNSAFLQEAKSIIQTQRQFYPNILTADFEEKYCNILTRKREYFEGPGSDKSRTDYGIYKTDGRTLNNLFEELIGHDQINPKELRAPNNSYTAQLFNLLNDLNNLTITTYEDGKISSADKQEIITTLKNATGNVQMLATIKKVAHCTDSDIRGYRTDPLNDKPDISSLASYRKVKKEFAKEGIDVDQWPTEFFDQLCFILTLNTEDGEIRKRIETGLAPKYKFLNKRIVQTIIDLKDSFKTSSKNKWHRFSLKTMNQLIPDMLQRPVEQMTLLSELGLIKNDHKKFKDNSYLPYKEIAEGIFNPVVAKSVRESLKIVNYFIKKYGTLDYIVVEMPRDKNEEEQKKFIQNLQKENAKVKDMAITTFSQSLSNPLDLESTLAKSGSGKLLTKIRLWYEQDGKCLYSGKTITANDLLQNPNMFEIDHIIPQSVSYDDSLANKTLCYAGMNQAKSQRTPYEFLITKDTKGAQTWEQYKAMVKANRTFSNKSNKAKKANLLFKDSLNSIETRKRFIARNLVDTRYASRVVLNNLQEFFSEKETGTKVSVVRGKFTSTLRKKWHLNKTRETFHHHAVDASIIATTPFLKIWNRGGSIFAKKIAENTIDIQTGEILNNTKFNELALSLPFKNFTDQFENIESKIKFSHQVDKKMNRRLSDDTIRSVRTTQIDGETKSFDYMTWKTKDIYTTEGFKNFKEIYDKNPNKFLMKQIDPSSFSKLEKIMSNYPAFEELLDQSSKVKRVDVSPFELYRREHGDIKKDSKKNKGPVIRRLKYYDKKVGTKIDITPSSAKNKKAILISLKPWRTDVFFNNDTHEYEIMGIKYSDLSNVKGTLGIKKQRYQAIKNKENISNNSEFKFSLYENNRIKVLNTETNESVEMLFLSRIKENQTLYVELKMIDSDKPHDTTLPIYGKVKEGGRIQKRLIPKKYNNVCRLWKVNTDIVGNTFYIEKEGDIPKNILV
ncbi:hypothetical protein LFYK43_07380 [Ligilactobacillus salitolerans]|uniref:CRISPR-associated endonuclease Cas9 n=1 Tax=Ligilactobacillus salitolerans TaxID=1808352 RepID=A0A401IRW8_9LACO|nr:type II CRISPR RNA-guided endonuclease Cas9 [Ligilactobacillus salitolerans]GBG94279.1 hypothetical protein LFYK43_07380 [Ligilactobacillus salitolerans]